MWSDLLCPPKAMTVTVIVFFSMENRANRESVKDI